MTDQADARAAERLLSPERLARLKALTGSTAEAVALHQETLRVGAGLLTVIASVEIALRNVVDTNLTTHFATPAWLTHPPAPFQWKAIENKTAQKALGSAQRAEYAKLAQSQKTALEAAAFPRGRPPNTSHMKRAIERRKQILVSNGKIIAETTFHFWKRLYGPDYDQTLWRTTLKRTFPNKTMKRPTVAIHLEHVYQARNRLAHHEPVLHQRFRQTVASVIFLAENLDVRTTDPHSPLMKMIQDDMAAVGQRADALHDRLDSYRRAAPPP